MTVIASFLSWFASASGYFGLVLAFFNKLDRYWALQVSKNMRSFLELVESK